MSKRHLFEAQNEDDPNAALSESTDVHVTEREVIFNRRESQMRRR